MESPRCERCGDGIGFFEPMLWLVPDGSIVAAALLAVGEDARLSHEESRFYHPACLASAETPGDS